MELLLAIAAELGKAAPRESLSRLAAIASITDVMPLTGRTRALVAAGLKALPGAKAPGLRALIRQCRLAAPMRAEDAGFAIGPRLNAAGRMGHPDDALALLLAADDRTAGAAMVRLEACNTERREVSGKVFALALKEAETQGDRPVIAVGNENWHIGVMGIVAQRLREATGKPALAVAFDADGLGTGSGRSAGGLHLEQLLGRLRNKLVRSGGHAAACGLTVQRSQWNDFRAALWADAATLERTPDELPQADATLEVRELTNELLQAIHALEPWGEGMAAPRFEAAVTLTGLRRFGRDEGKPHAELTVKGLPRPLVFWRGADEMTDRKGAVKLLLRPGRDSFTVEAVDFS